MMSLYPNLILPVKNIINLIYIFRNDIFSYTKKGDTAAVKKILDSGEVDVNAKDDQV